MFVAETGFFMHPLANFCPDELDQVHQEVLTAAAATRLCQPRLRSFVHATGLPIRL